MVIDGRLCIDAGDGFGCEWLSSKLLLCEYMNIFSLKENCDNFQSSIFSAWKLEAWETAVRAFAIDKLDGLLAIAEIDKIIHAIVRKTESSNLNIFTSIVYIKL